MIHPSAIIDQSAELAAGVEIGPYAIIGKQVTIGAGTKIGAHAVIGDWTAIGENNQIFHQSSVGAPPQDLKYRGEETWTHLGDNNVVREFATIHRGTVTGHGKTVVGSGNLFMAYSHIAHDCCIGNNVVMANVATLAGHVTVQDHVILGGLVAVHQFSTIGAHAMIGGGTLVGLDILPYTIATSGKRDAQLRGLNLIGLKRRGFSDETINSLKKAYKTLFMADLKLEEAVARIRSELGGCPEVDYLLAFIENSKRGICRG
ncbi:acyl-ACP--UDP-N-acetylglucosamine O-acyltransferase [Geobacter sp. SVR]|uniref:acyl-ACP--UDP-N-acetylglucosamine O-acyltransferase n=1 Tax=Geobacter sp. SVR TaxID=2495594 RepID=UPI00143EFE64|nr:acyl-ACP--UDP-N-acetylglucosamine O-acyltransferase [Geobacter sp. SVR]BCS52432.1 acyl-[acyl-carrier-protein]--UDP-N-acetylglucosamine O-acyltransferase [Geobacter sp. SVR]GCF87337.1 acyl-[acyl-carrier-protein]--UDP-N-acetylglucosamine O-acyltransferase [Geobacter sp. SVR]